MIPKYKTWLEYRDMDSIEQAVLGVVGGDQVLHGPERDHLKQRHTTEFAQDVKARLRNLGIIANISSDNKDRYSDIQDSINRGVTIGELIEKIRGPNAAPNAAIQPSEKNV